MTKDQYEILGQIQEMLGIKFIGDKNNAKEIEEFIHKWIDRLETAYSEMYNDFDL